MVAGENHDSGIAAKLMNQGIIKAADDHRQPSILPLSNFDRLMGGFLVTIFYAYRKPSTGDFDSIVAAIKTSLSETLTHFYPFAGRIVRNSATGEAEILCNNAGINFMEARASVPLATLDFHDQNQSIRKVLLPVLPEHPLSVQVTGYTCGGFSVAWCFDHRLADATAFIKFLNSWSQIARAKQVSSVAINHDRSIFRPRSPPLYGPSVGRTYTVCTMDDILSMPPNGISQKRSYYVEGPCLERLREASSRGVSKRTRTEALSAYLWKVMARACGGGDSNNRCKMGWLIDGRRRMAARNHDDSMSNYVGNVVSIAVGEESAQELKHRPLSHVAGIVSGAITEAANDGHFLDLIDWIECHRPGMMLPELLLGLRVPALVVSSCHNMPVMAVDFGFGRPSLGMFYSTVDQIGAGYVNLVSSGREDGGWLVSTFIWPELADALESDPDHVFQPITADHLGRSQQNFWAQAQLSLQIRPTYAAQVHPNARLASVASASSAR